jgi:benzil reductase ((S)-benzoin forming)
MRRPRAGGPIRSGDRFALVTGTSAGIGAAVAARLLERGWRVIGVARRAAALDHRSYRHVSADLADPASLPKIDDAVAAGLQASEPTRVGLVNNAAAGGLLAPMERIDPSALHRMTAANFVAPLHLMGFMVAHAPAGAALRIVNVSSGAAVRAFPGLSAYSGTKAALRMAGMVLAAELESPLRNTPAPRDCAIVSYEPGAVDTDMQTGARSVSAEAFPWVTLFHEFKARGILLDPRHPAEKIVGFLEADGLPVFSEQRM